MQQNRLLLGEQICEKLSNNENNSNILGYDTPEFIIMYEDILRQQMNNMSGNMLENMKDTMDEKRNENGLQYIL